MLDFYFFYRFLRIFFIFFLHKKISGQSTGIKQENMPTTTQNKKKTALTLRPSSYIFE